MQSGYAVTQTARSCSWLLVRPIGDGGGRTKAVIGGCGCGGRVEAARPLILVSGGLIIVVRIIRVVRMTALGL